MCRYAARRPPRSGGPGGGDTRRRVSSDDGDRYRRRRVSHRRSPSGGAVRSSRELDAPAPITRSDRRRNRGGRGRRCVSSDNRVRMDRFRTDGDRIRGDALSAPPRRRSPAQRRGRPDRGGIRVPRGVHLDDRQPLERVRRDVLFGSQVRKDGLYRYHGVAVLSRQLDQAADSPVRVAVTPRPGSLGRVAVHSIGERRDRTGATHHRPHERTRLLELRRDRRRGRDASLFGRGTVRFAVSRPPERF